MFKFIDDEQPTHFAVAFDVHQPTFRHEMFKEYKGTRKPMLPELRRAGSNYQGFAKENEYYGN